MTYENPGYLNGWADTWVGLVVSHSVLVAARSLERGTSTVNSPESTVASGSFRQYFPSGIYFLVIPGPRCLFENQYLRRLDLPIASHILRSHTSASTKGLSGLPILPLQPLRPQRPFNSQLPSTPLENPSLAKYFPPQITILLLYFDKFFFVLIQTSVSAYFGCC